MSARQNKKQRKGRNNPNNRERTVLTLTEDPNTPYLVPTPTEDPPGALMSSPFSVASSSAGNQPSVPSSAYQMPGNYTAFGYTNFGGPVHGNMHHQHPQQQYYAPQQQQPQGDVALPPGPSDLELLEHLKETIKNGQHEFYRAIPQPSALLDLYLGPANSSSQVPPHPEQVPEKVPQAATASASSPSQANPPQGAVSPASPADSGRRPPRVQGKESWDPAGPPKHPSAEASGTASQPVDNNVQGPDGQFGQGSGAQGMSATSNLKNASNSPSSPLSAISPTDKISMNVSIVKPPLSTTVNLVPSNAQTSVGRYETAAAASHPGDSAPIGSDQTRALADRPGRGEYGIARLGYVDRLSGYDSKNDSLRPQWSSRDGVAHADDRRHHDLDRPPSSATRSTNGNGASDPRATGLSERLVGPPRDDRFSDRDREKDRDRERRDWEHERDRRSFDRYRDPRVTDMSRPPLEQRHYEPEYGRGPVRRYEPKGADEPLPPNRRLSDARPVRQPVGEDRLSRGSSVDSRLPLDSRISQPDSRAPAFPDSRGGVSMESGRPLRDASFDDRDAKPPLAEGDRRRLTTSDQASRPARPSDVSGFGDRAAMEDRGPGAQGNRNTRPLEDRISRPSLQDRLDQPPAPAARIDANERPTRQPSLEERLSHPPVSSVDRHSLPPASRASGVVDHIKMAEPPRPVVPAQDDRTGRPVERYVRPPTSSATEAGSRSYPPRQASIVREEPRSGRSVPSPPPPSREFRLARPASRERLGPGYRDDRSGYGDRRGLDLMDIDSPLPARYGDHRGAPYDRTFSPPSAADPGRDRAKAQFPPSPHRPPLDAPPYDDRYSAREWQYPQYDRRREWTDEDPYWKQRSQWDRNNPPADRDRYDRDVPPLAARSWEARDDRDNRRDSYPPPPPPPRTHSPPRAYDGGPPRPPGSRPGDGYNGPSAGMPVDSRPYPGPSSRDAPPFGRVRPRSPSPAPRRSGPPSVDDARPPIKRTRDDAFQSTSAGYYPPPSRDAHPPPPPPSGSSTASSRSQYPPRGSPPPPSSASSGAYYDRSGTAPPPPTSASTTASGPNDREFAGGRDFHPTYERPRSPGPPPPPRAGYARGGYARGPDSRDDRRYPPPSSLPPPRRP